jgi:beta-xylosidase
VSPRRPVAALTAVILLAAACAAKPSGTGAPASVSPVGSPFGAATESAAASVPAGDFVNPVIREDFADPFVLRAGGKYYAYATNNGGNHIQLEKSMDLVAWEWLPDALPKLPAWSSGDTWAPEVAKTSAGYVLYYTAHDSDLRRPDSNGAQCITLAVSAAPEGPFVDSSKAPLVCQPTLGGSIDATAFVDQDGSRHLIWKNDGNCCGLPTRLFNQPLTADGLKLTGKATDIGVVNDEQWEGAVIEAPTLLFHDGTYFLFYSANGYDSEFYSIGYATSKKLTGPYVDAPENPIVSSAWDPSVTSRARGPGHQSIVEDAKGQLWMTFHAWDQEAVGYANGGMRTMWIDKLTFDGGKPVVDGPKDAPQPIP